MALKLKLAALWLFTGMAYLAYMVSMLMLPGAIDAMLAGEIPELQNPLIMLTITLTLLILFIMPFLTLTLKDSINRRVNIILGIIYAVLEFGALIDKFTNTQKTYAHIIITTCSKIVATVLIAWYAWKWPKQEA